MPPLGYDVRDRCLVVNAAEAATVKLIYQLYLRLGSVRLARRQPAQGAAAVFRAIGLLVRYQFYPAVLGPSFSRLVGGDEIRLPIPVRSHAVFGHFVVCQVSHHRVGAALGEPQVVPTRPDRVAVAIDVDRHVRTFERPGGTSRLTRAGPTVGFD